MEPSATRSPSPYRHNRHNHGYERHDQWAMRMVRYRRAVRAIPRRRVGKVGHRRQEAFRIPNSRGGTGWIKLDYHPEKKRRVSRSVFRFRPGAGSQDDPGRRGATDAFSRDHSQQVKDRICH